MTADQTIETTDTENVDTAAVTTRQEPEATNPNREAAKYRRQLRDTETERDGLRGQLDGIRGQVLARELGSLSDPAYLFTFGPSKDSADYFTTEGTLDHTKLTADLDQLRAERPELFENSQVDKWRQQVSEETGLPAEVLAGGTLEEIRAHAERCRPFISNAPYVRDPGKTPETSGRVQASWAEALDTNTVSTS